MSSDVVVITLILVWQRSIFYDKEIQTEWNLMRLRFHETILHKADKLLLDADLPDREGKLFGEVFGKYAAG